ncbi:hypothetical protein EDB85DRAFT_2153439 [Lactarius pseudohatsudake]|nr:hypothetical protein EDB85DRAFT_2153439 [Lactarius pseudohatsudake]
MVLGKEKETTEAYLSEDIVTVVTCLLQCLQILCIINEFKAAAITYGLDKKSSRCLARSLFDPFTPMTFIIVWNGLYNANKEERNTVEERVQAHLVRRKLWRRKVKFVFMRPTGFVAIIVCRLRVIATVVVSWSHHLLMVTRRRRSRPL